ncbi:MAG: coenzyme F420-0:L-glutamate ligase [Bacillota bacterium]
MEFKNDCNTTNNKKIITKCIPVKTGVIKPGGSIIDEAVNNVKPSLEKGDIVVCSEKAVAFSQGRVIDEKEVKVSPLAAALSRFVTNNPYGQGMRDPRNMQVAINMVGPARVVLAAIIGGIAKLIGLNGYFYKVAGPEVSMIDGVVEHRFEELQKYIVPPPANPDQAARSISDALEGYTVVIMDVNDIGGSTVIGKSCDNLPINEIEEFMRYDNPLGQGTQQTPFGILRG